MGLVRSFGFRPRFQCQPGCTECCRQPGFVYLTESDLSQAAAFVGLAPAEFEKRYLVRTPRRLRFRVPPKGTCPFLTESGCSIHPAKPTQCRVFPFWPELIESKREWRKAARYCPGMAHGPLVSIQSARTQAEEMRQGYPAMYED